MALRSKALCLLLALLIQGCAPLGRAPDSLPPIDTSISARSQNSRVQFVVIHYTVSNLTRALSLLAEGAVSSHYLITDEEPVRIYQLVDEGRSAWHAGESEWRGRTWLNSSSIGIEIVNRGPVQTADGPGWQPYSAAQVAALRALLHDIVARHDIAPENIVGHSDIAPLRKQDPGPLFPWKQLAEDGLGRWYDATAAAALQARFELQGLPDVIWVQRQLLRLGYAVVQSGLVDADTKAVLSAFQMHYRPSRHDGLLDAETAGIIAALLAAEPA